MVLNRLKSALVMVMIVCSLGTQNVLAAETPSTSLNDRFQKLQTLAGNLEKKGKLDTYAKMRLTLIGQFLNYFKTDKDMFPDTLGKYEARDLEILIAGESKRLAAISEGKAPLLYSPRRVKTERPKVVKDHFEQKVQWPDGRVENRPIFLFGFGHNHYMRNDIDFLAQLGVNIAQVEFYMPSMMPAEDRWDPGVAENLRNWIKYADEKGVLTDVLLALHYMPEWVYEKNPDWRIHLGGFLSYPINQPEVRTFLSGFMKRALAEIGDSFWSCCLLNEPSFFLWTGDPDTKRLWRNYLIGNFGTIEALNKKWGTDYHDWLEVPAYLNPNEKNFAALPGTYDWMQFNNNRIAGFAEWIQSQVREVRPGKLTHAKILNREFETYNVIQGTDPYETQRVTDICGTDALGVGSFPEGTLLGLMYKNVRRKPILNSEHHFLTDGGVADVTPGQVRSQFWTDVLGGLDGSIAWIWGRHPENPTLGHWSYRPLQTEEYIRTGLDLMRLMPDVLVLRNTPAPVTLLYSRTSVLRDTDHAASLKKTAELLFEAGIPFEVVTEQTLSGGQVFKRVPTTKVFILAGCKNLSDGCINALKWLEFEHVKILTIGKDFGTFNEYNRPRKEFLVKIDPANIPDVKAGDYRKQLVSTLEKLGVAPEIRLLDAATGRPVEDVIVRTAGQGENLLAMAINRSRKPMTVVWSDRQNEKYTFADKLDLFGSTAKSFTLEPDGVVLGTLSVK